MQIKFLGTGSAFTLKNFQTNLIITNNKKNLLLDAGSYLPLALDSQKMSYKDIDAVYISHLHADHCGGIEYLGFCTYFDPSAKRIKLYGNGELLRRGWEDSWKGGLESIQGKLLALDGFFDVIPIRPNESFIWEGITFKIVQSTHIMNGYSIVLCYGLMIQTNSKTIYWTSDCQFCPNQIIDFYKQADIIIQDCETAPYKSGVHAHFSELVTLPEEIKKKMILVHYQDNVFYGSSNTITDEWHQKANDAKFLKFAEQGQSFFSSLL